jgi:hypothetical protein
MKCIIKYKEQDNECFCHKLKECNKCNNKDNRESDEKCNVEIGGYCTCRTCGYVVRS